MNKEFPAITWTSGYRDENIPEKSVAHTSDPRFKCDCRLDIPKILPDNAKTTNKIVITGEDETLIELLGESTKHIPKSNPTVIKRIAISFIDVPVCWRKLQDVRSQIVQITITPLVAKIKVEVLFILPNRAPSIACSVFE